MAIQSQYQLRCELRGHDDDVRRICICGDIGVATSSRDKSIRLWTQSTLDRRKYELSKILLGHSSFVGPLAWISPSKEFPQGGVVSGGMDALIMVWNLETGDNVHILRGHHQQVTGLLLDDEYIVSCSVDGTLKRWKKIEVIEDWHAHASAVQAVIKLPSGDLVTSSSDKTIKHWRGRKCIQTFIGHTDTVRSLSLMCGTSILSASHDGSVRLWDMTGTMVMEMLGHSSLVYSVDSHPSGLIVSGSEDCTAKIWKDGVCVQSIEHPGCVWDTKFMVNGDIITGCSDGIARIWSLQQELIADVEDLQLYTSHLSQHRICGKSVGGLKLGDLPGLEALNNPGTTDGQIKVIREADTGVAYSWNLCDKKWDKIGEVVDPPSDCMQQPNFEGKEYDFVFDVDIGDGEPIRKLPYNQADNPYEVADNWLLKENLPTFYRQQIVDFILKNCGQKMLVDHPSHNPFVQSAIVGKATFKHIPKKGMLICDVCNFDGILKKIKEFNQVLISCPDKINLSLSEHEQCRLSDIIKILRDTSHFHESRLDEDAIALLLKLLRHWPDEMVFPVVDMVRMVVLHSDGSHTIFKEINSENDILLNLLSRASKSLSLQNLLMSIRFVVNLFKDYSFHSWLQKHLNMVLDAFFSWCTYKNKNLQLSYSTLIINYAVLLIEKGDREGQFKILTAAFEIVRDANMDADSRFRALVAIGSLMLDEFVKEKALEMGIADVIARQKTSSEARIAEVGADIGLLIAQSSHNTSKQYVGFQES